MCLILSRAEHVSTFVGSYQGISVFWHSLGTESVFAFVGLYQGLGACIESRAGICMCLQVPRTDRCVCIESVFAFVGLYQGLGACIESRAGICMCLQVPRTDRCVCICQHSLRAERVPACVCMSGAYCQTQAGNIRCYSVIINSSSSG